MQKTLRTYYGITGLYTLAASLIWGVNTLFLLDAGLDILGVFIANAAFSAGMVIFEIPTGLVADTKGRRLSFLLSTAVLIITTVAYVLAAGQGAGLWVFIVISALLGLGFTFYSGAVEAWLVDALAADGFDGELDHVFARSQVISGAAMLVGTVGGGLLGGISLDLPFVVRSGLLAVLFVVAYLGMHDRGFTPEPRTGSLLEDIGASARTSIRIGWQHGGLRALMLAGAVLSSFFMWAWYAWQPYFLDLLGRDAIWVAGVVSALIAASMIGGNLIVEWLSRACRRRSTLLAWGYGVIAVGSIGVGLATSFWVAVASFLVIAVAMGVVSPVQMAYLHSVVDSEHRATVVSVNSMVSGIGGVGGQIGLGALAQGRSISAGYLLGGALTALALPFVAVVRRIGGPPDQIHGTRAGAESTCAAPALPAIATVDAGHRGSE